MYFRNILILAFCVLTGVFGQSAYAYALTVSPPSPITIPATVTAEFDTTSCQSYTLTWGDGTNSDNTVPTDQNCLPALMPGHQVQHTYNTAGEYTVSLTKNGVTEIVFVSVTAPFGLPPPTGGGQGTTQNSTDNNSSTGYTKSDGGASNTDNKSALISQLQVQLAQLVAQLKQLQVAEGAKPVCVLLNRNLSLGARGSDVTRLQNFLRMTNDFSVDSTEYYGQLTVQAVKNWQTHNGIVSSGTAETTGYGAVGPRTREAMGLCR